MAKDPAVLFYTNDFLSGVSSLTMEERGQYITLLALQHQNGHLSKKAININVPNCSQDVLDKFLIDDNGLYYQKRMDEETEKRRLFVESRYANGYKGGRPKNNLVVNHKDNHIEDEDVNDNIITYYSNNIHTITPIEYERLTKWEETFNKDMIKYAIELAVKANARSFNYIEAIFKSWKTKGYKTIIDIERLDKKKKERDLPSWFNEDIKREEPEISEEERKEIDDIVKEMEQFKEKGE